MEAEKQETLAVETGQPETEGIPLQKHWYVIHTYSGYENKVKANLERKILSMGLENKIFNVIVPMDDDVEMQNGRKKVIKRKVFPGYVLVEMIVDDQSWYVVRNTPGVTGFVGSESTKPIPLTESEVANILRPEGESIRRRPMIDVEPGQSVRISSGAFEGQPATVTEVDRERGRLKVVFEIFGRETVTDLNFDQVEKI
jgi:transcriptional antiterminator NusG